MSADPDCRGVKAGVLEYRVHSPSCGSLALWVLLEGRRRRVLLYTLSENSDVKHSS